MLSFMFLALTFISPPGSQATKIRPRCRAHRPSTSFAILVCESDPSYHRLSPLSEPNTNYDILYQISAVKEKIAAEKGWDPKSQKLIYSGLICLGFALLRRAGSDPI